MSASRRILIAEIFGPTIQGEGALIGQPTVFVRTGGCDYRCSWCDSLHAVDPAHSHDWTPMSSKEIWRRVEELSGGAPLMVSLSGGNPALQPLRELIMTGHRHGYSFALETQGSIAKDWFSLLDMLILSPKPPSSGMETDFEQLDACMRAAGKRPETVLKIIVFNEADYQFAREIAARHPHLALYLQPGNHTPPGPGADTAPVELETLNERLRWLIGRVNSDRWFDVRVLPQLHVMLWGNQRGV